jgi:hypothetical protein
MADEHRHEQHPSDQDDATTERPPGDGNDAQPAPDDSDNDGPVEDEQQTDDGTEDDDVDRAHDRYGFLSGPAAVFGTVTLHGRDRDVTTVLDGSSALRLLKIFEQRSNGTLADRLNVVTSSVHNAWLVADLDECIAVSWWPGLPKKAPRTAIDPVIDAV